MYGIPVIDVPSLCIRYARSALPKAPVLQEDKRWRLRVAARSARR